MGSEKRGSEIQWTGQTWNPWHGCAKISEGCKFCYMYRDKERYGQKPTTVLKSKTKFQQPLKWREPELVFTCSWSDFFIEDADLWRDEAWEIIKQTPQHQYQILTKRPERILDHLPADWGEGYDNVWLGVSVESNKVLDRIVTLASIPAQIRFVSAEPLLEELYLEELSESVIRKIHWMIIGGESGNDTGNYRYRPCEKGWIERLSAYCHGFGIQVFIKQLGTFIAKEEGLRNRHGGNMVEWDASLQIREFPRDVSMFRLE